MRKKILSLLTTFCMVLTMIVGSNATILAAGAKTGSITISGLNKGTEYQVYKMIDLNIDENGTISSPMYKWDEDMFDIIDAEYPKYLDDNGGVSDQYLVEMEESDLSYGEVPDRTKNITDFYFDVARELRMQDMKSDYEGISDGKSVTINGLSQGQYVVLACDRADEKGADIYYPSVFNILQDDKGEISPVEITMKKKPITVEKTVDSKPSGIGEVKEYTITSDLPVFPGLYEGPRLRYTIESATQVKYIIGDRLSAGLTLDENSIQVFVGKSTTPLIKDKDYQLNLNPENGATFTIELSPIFLYENQGAQVKVTYNATVNENAVVKDNLQNTATVEFSNDPFDEDSTITITTEEEAYTYNLKFTKVDETDPNTVLAKVEFELAKNGKALWFKKVGSDYVLSENQENPGDGYTKKLVTADTGVISIQGLDANAEYELKETKPHSDDYVLPSTVGTITLKDGETDKDADGKLDAGTSIEGLTVVKDSIDISSDTATFAFKLSNKKVGDLDLPVTGGAGTLMFTVGGLAVMGGAVYLFVSNKKKHAK